MGDKVTAKDTMIKAGVPVVPGIKWIAQRRCTRYKIANQIGYPVILKATAGGGGKGMRIVRNDGEFDDAWHSAKQEAKASFSNDGIYVEKYVEEPRHIEFQIVGDQFGNVAHLSERLFNQRRHQKLVEEAHLRL